MNHITNFLKTKTGLQLYSFLKTYITVFLGIYLSLQSIANELDLQSLASVNLTDLNILLISAKGAFISVIRNIYKLLTE